MGQINWCLSLASLYSLVMIFVGKPWSPLGVGCTWNVLHLVRLKPNLQTFD